MYIPPFLFIYALYLPSPLSTCYFLSVDGFKKKSISFAVASCPLPPTFFFFSVITCRPLLRILLSARMRRASMVTTSFPEVSFVSLIYRRHRVHASSLTFSRLLFACMIIIHWAAFMGSACQHYRSVLI